MTNRTAAMVAITASLTVLLSGCAGTAADGGSAEPGRAGGRVQSEEFTRTAPRDASVRAVEPRSWSGEALREFHGARATAPVSRAGWSDEIVRELKGSESLPVQRPFTPEQMRELKGSSSGTGGGE